MRAAIIGAGLNGISMALALRRFDIDAVVFDDAPEPRSDGSGIYVWPQGVQALKALLGNNGFLRCGHPIDEMTTHELSGRLIQSQPVVTAESALSAPACMFRRGRLYATLVDALGARHIQSRRRCKGVRNLPDGAQAFFQDGSRPVFDVVIGADGINSQVRQSLFPERNSVYAGVSVSRGIVEFQHDLLRGDSCQIFAGEGCRIVTYPTLSGTSERYWFAAYVRAGNDSLFDKRQLLEHFALFPDFLKRMLAATEDAEILAAPLKDLDPLDNWVAGRVALVGDAAHGQLPTIGNGLSLGLENCFLLAQSLAASTKGVEAGLLRYQRKARVRSNDAMSLAREFTDVFYRNSGEVTPDRLNALFRQFAMNVEMSPL